VPLNDDLAADHLSSLQGKSVAGLDCDGLLPLVLGVTGHRDLDRADYPIYRARVAEFLSSLRRQFPATPLRVLSSMAEGADRLAAEVALDHGCELLVPLPLEPAEYERDFPDSTDEFRALLGRIPAEQVFVLEHTAGHAPPHWSAAGHRDLSYREAGAYMTRQSHVLLALWDGLDNDSIAGTAAVVRLKLEGQSLSHALDPRALDSDDTGPVFHVHSPRVGSGGNPDQPGRWLFPRDVDAKAFHRVCAHMDRFNRDALEARDEAAVAEATASLLSQLDERPGGDRAVARTFARADRLARHHQRLTHAVLRLVLGLAAALALTFEVYAEILPRREVPAVYLLLFSAVAGLYLWQKRRDAQGRYLDYRALAEGLRVQFYWRVAGLRDNASSNYLRKQLDELRWIREALRGANTVPPSRQPRLDLVMRFWVQGQALYYRNRALLQRTRISRVERLSTLCLATGLLATATLVILWNRLPPIGEWRHWLVVVMGFAPISAALWEAYGERFGLRTQAHQYARFAVIFGRAEQAFERLEATPVARRRHESERGLIRELGRESLMETGDWVLLLRDRPIALPKG
jgi:hypothetical protein